VAGGADQAPLVGELVDLDRGVDLLEVRVDSHDLAASWRAGPDRVVGCADPLTERVLERSGLDLGDDVAALRVDAIDDAVVALHPERIEGGDEPVRTVGNRHLSEQPVVE
jgi:hypothetical protein